MRRGITLLALIGGCQSQGDLAEEEAQAWIDSLRIAPPTGGVAPEFALPVIDASGLTTDSVHLIEARGRVVVLNFWATWCKPCVAEHETFARLAERFAADSVQFLGIVGLDTPGRVAAFDSLNATGYPNLFDADETVSKLYQLRGVPHHVIIDRTGRVVFSAPGGPIAERAFALAIERTLIGQVDSLHEVYSDARSEERRNSR